MCLFAFFLLFTFTTAANAASDFTYKIPDGWENLKITSRDSEFNSILMTEAKSGKYAVYVADPRNNKTRLGSTFNVLEAQTTGRITQQTADKAGSDLVQQLGRVGMNYRLIEAKVVKIGGVDCSLTVGDMDTVEGRRRLMQYLVPGEKMTAIMSYSAPVDEFDRYRSVFEASAMGTKGAYAHGGFSFKRSLMVGAITGGIAMIASWIIAMTRRRRDREAELTGEEQVRPSFAKARPAAAPTAATTSARATKYTWVCPDCNNPVPIRLDTCRCGGRKPA